VCLVNPSFKRPDLKFIALKNVVPTSIFQEAEFMLATSSVQISRYLTVLVFLLFLLSIAPSLSLINLFFP
jgi:hypothetical protein